jgi:hypothetical protein
MARFAADCFVTLATRPESTRPRVGWLTSRRSRRAPQRPCCAGPDRLLGEESRAKVEAKVRAELAYLRQRLDRLEERLPARIEAEVVAARRALGG